MSEPARISYRTRQGHEPGEELSALREIYELAIRKAAAKKKACGTNAGDEDPKGDRDDRVKRSIP